MQENRSLRAALGQTVLEAPGTGITCVRRERQRVKAVNSWQKVKLDRDADDQWEGVLAGGRTAGGGLSVVTSIPALLCHARQAPL